MAYYVAPFTFDFPSSRIIVDVGFPDVSVIDLYESCAIARASEEGILYDAIAKGSGLVSLGGGTQVGLTVELLGSWQIRFASGDYIARISQGNLVGGPGGDPIAYSAGVQVLLIQSAASTVVTVDGSGGSGSAPTAAQNAAAVWSAAARTLTERAVDAELEPGFSVARAMRIIAAAVAGKTTGGPGGFVARNLGDTTDQITGSADESGNRSSSSYGA